MPYHGRQVADPIRVAVAVLRMIEGLALQDFNRAPLG